MNCRARTSPPFKLATLLVALSTAWTAHAQSEVNALPEVLVQSGRLEQRQFDAPASVSSIDRSTIESSGPQVNASDVLNRLPSVVALNRNNYAQDLQISIRGFGARAAFGLRGIRLLTDGIPASTPDGQGQASTISLTSAQRIEVLTGPLAQIYGNASGGVIQAFTREATAKPELTEQVFLGSYGLRRTDTQMGGRIGQAGIVADWSTLSLDGYRQNSEVRRQQLNAVVTVDASEDTRWKLVLNVFRMPQARDPLGLQLSQLGKPSQAGYGAAIDGTRKIVSQDQLGWVLDHRVGADVHLSTRLYSGMRDNLQYQALANASNPTNPNGRWTGLSRHFSGWGLQLKGQSRGTSVPFDWVTGIDIDRSGEVRQAGATLNGQKTAAGATRNELNASGNKDFFAQANWYLHEKWTLATGVRASQVSLRSSDYYLVDGVDGSGRVQYKATTPVLGITHHVTDTWNAYANFGKGFETPTLAEAAFISVAGAPKGQFNTGLQAARSRHFELGSKWTPSPASRIQVALFRISTTNEIIPDVSASGSTAFVNAAHTLRQGLELSWQQWLQRHWRADLSANWMQATYDQGFKSTASGTVAAGSRIPSIPARKLFAGLSWSQAGHSAQAPSQRQGLEADLELVARSRIYANDLNTLYAPGHATWNARLRHLHRTARYTLETHLGVDNLSNRETIGSVIVNQSSAQSFEPGLPRNWVLGWKLRVNI